MSSIACVKLTACLIGSSLFSIYQGTFRNYWSGYGASNSYSISQHFLRGEQGIYYEDLHPLICWLPRFSCQPPAIPTKADALPLWSETADDECLMEKGPSPRPGASIASLPVLQSDENKSPASSFSASRKKKIFDPEAALPNVISDRPLKPSRNPPATTFWDHLGFLRFLRPIFRVIRGQHTHDLTAGGRVKKRMDVESNVPLEISLFLESYAGWLINQGLLPGPIAGALVSNIAALQNIETSLERIRNTPLPFAYQAHLRICTWCVSLCFCSETPSYVSLLAVHLLFTFPNLYCVRMVDHPVRVLSFSMKMRKNNSFGRATTFCAFLLLGFLEIGAQM